MPLQHYDNLALEGYTWKLFISLQSPGEKRRESTSVIISWTVCTWLVAAQHYREQNYPRAYSREIAEIKKTLRVDHWELVIILLSMVIFPSDLCLWNIMATDILCGADISTRGGVRLICSRNMQPRWWQQRAANSWKCRRFRFFYVRDAPTSKKQPFSNWTKIWAMSEGWMTQREESSNRQSAAKKMQERWMVESKS